MERDEGSVKHTVEGGEKWRRGGRMERGWREGCKEKTKKPGDGMER